MVCQICGTSNPDNAVYCASCGTRLPQNNARAYTQGTYPPPSQNYTNAAPQYDAATARWRAETPVKPGDPSKNWAGITRFIMGILSVIAAPITSLLAIPGLIISIVGRKSQQKGLAIAGIITSVIGLLILALILVGVAALLNYGYSSFGGDFDEFYDYFNDFAGSARQSLATLALLFPR